MKDLAGSIDESARWGLRYLDFTTALDQCRALRPIDFRTPRIDKAMVEEAITECLSLQGCAARPLRWFPDAKSAHEFLYPYDAIKSYWPLGRSSHAMILDVAWRAATPVPPQNNIRQTDLPTTIVDHLRQQVLQYNRRRQVLPQRIVELLRHVSGLGDPRFVPDRTQYDLSAGATPLLKAFLAGLYYFRVGRNAVACVPRPSIWFANDRLHRIDGPAVEWPTGERYFFCRGMQVSQWLIEHRDEITIKMIRGDRSRNAEYRRCLIELFGVERFLREAGVRLIKQDRYGQLWDVMLTASESCVLLEVENGTCEPDGARRRYFLEVPPWVDSPHQAVAWTFGLSTEQYKIALRT